MPWETATRAIWAKVPQKNGETQVTKGYRWCMSVIYLIGSAMLPAIRQKGPAEQA